LSASFEAAGFGMLLWVGPFCTEPGTHVSELNPSGTIEPLKSSLAWSLNSTRMVRSLASCIVLACLNFCALMALGLFPVRIDSASSFASWRAATGLPLACLRS
jgi:hypothetical protein